MRLHDLIRDISIKPYELFAANRRAAGKALAARNTKRCDSMLLEFCGLQGAIFHDMVFTRQAMAGTLQDIGDKYSRYAAFARFIFWHAPTAAMRADFRNMPLIFPKAKKLHLLALL